MPMTRWRALLTRLQGPWSLPATLLVLALAFMIVQPLMQLLIVHGVFREPLPFQSFAQWRTFALAAGGLGLVAGAAWYQAERHPSAALRFWLGCVVWALWIAPLGFAERVVSAGVLPWLLVNLLISAVVGTLWLGVAALFGLLPRRSGG